MSRNLSDQGDPSCKIFVGDLSTSVTKQDLNDAFSYYGPIRHSWVARNPPGFGFVEFEDPRDAEDAVKDRKKDGGKLICGRRVRVELFNRSKMHSKYHYVNKGRPYRPENRCYECGVRGHYARNCYKHKRGFRRRYRSRTPDRHYRGRGKYSSRSHSDSRRSRSNSRRSESIERRSFSNDRKRSISKSRSRTPLRKKRVSTSRSNSKSD